MLKIDARLVVHAVDVRIGDKATEILIAHIIRREKDKVERLLVRLPLAVGHPPPCDVGLNADDRLDAAFRCRLHKLNAPVEGAVIGNRNRVHAELLRLVEQGVDLA